RSERLFERLSLGYIYRQDCDPAWHRLHTEFEPRFLSIGELKKVFNGIRRTGLHAFCQCGKHVSVFDARVALHHRSPEKLFSWQARLSDDSVIHVCVAELLVDDLTPLDEVVQDLARQFMALDRS